MPDGWQPDASQRIQALSSLIQTDAQKVIPILREIALESPDPGEARRAVFVLAQSGKPEAYSCVLEIARSGNETVQIAAVRGLGQFGGRDVADQLLQVYTTVNPRVKFQVVDSLGERAATSALLRIAETEDDKRLKETAIVRLGQAGAGDQLQRYYFRARTDLKEPIIRALVLAKAEDALIRIAETEGDETIRRQAISGLRLLGSAKARQFIEKREIEKRQQNR
jgi:HEAT repeat protein